MERFLGTLQMFSSQASRDDQPLSSARLRFHTLTWLGLAIAAAGWGLLITAVMLDQAMIKDASLGALASFRGDGVTLAQTAIGSGLALAILGVLRSGFGVLHQFFETVLDRSSASKPAAAPAPTPVQPIAVEPVFIDEPAPPIVPKTERFVRAPSSGGGAAKPGRHNYVIRSDGSVEVETLLGTRIFATMDEAKDFIR